MLDITPPNFNEPLKSSNSNLGGRFLNHRRRRRNFSRRLAPAINKKEERREPNEQQRPRNHFSFEQTDRRDLMARDEGHADSQHRRRQPTTPGHQQLRSAVVTFASRRLFRQPQD